MKNFPLTETTFLLAGPAGDLEVLATPAPEEISHRNAIAVICHPHPLHGGTMHNKVVTTLAKTFRELGMPSVRFNYRGVGKSVGKFADGIGETDDLLAVVRWAQETNPEKKLWLAGFSFGAFVSARAAAKLDVAQLVSVAPQVSRFIEDKIPEILIPWVLAQGEQDEVIPPEEVFAWIETLKHPPVLIRMPAAGHFFHGKLTELRENLLMVLREK
jgi:alpha/beta superfamily hydrolase